MQNTDSDIRKLEISDAQKVAEIFGRDDIYLNRLRQVFHVNVVLRGDELIISGGEGAKAVSALQDMIWLLEHGEALDERRVDEILEINEEGGTVRQRGVKNDIICFSNRGKPIRAKTQGQMQYAESIRNNDIAFGIGPAGTGKTYLAVAMAVRAFKDRDVERIILTRPAVEAGESLGFLPGDMQEKVNPYLRPLFDALYDILGRDTTARLREKEVIEIIPLAYMRGRTLDNAFIILDEAQNTTREQMKMFLTRLGFGSKAVVTGDVTQIDLPKKKNSGLVDARRILSGIDGIGFTVFNDRDVVRHPLVRKIINAYKKAEERD